MTVPSDSLELLDAVDWVASVVPIDRIGGPDYVHAAAERSHGLGLFIRSLVGLEQGAAKEAMADFIYAKEFTSVQIDFVKLIIDHLCTTGVVEASRLYESPFTDLSPQGPEGIFQPGQVDQLSLGSALRQI